MTLYGRIERLCRQSGITITEMCRRSGANRASLSDLKVGRKSTLSPETLAKIATYFGTTVDYVFGIDVQSGIDDCKYELSELKAKLSREQDASKIEELNFQIGILEESLSDQNLAQSMIQNGQKNKPGAVRQATEDEIKAALWGGEKDLTETDVDELWEDVKTYAAFKTIQRKKKR